MDVIETLRQEVQEGRLGPERLVELMASLQRQLQATHQQLQETQQQLEAARRRIEELEKQLGGPPPTAKLDQPFSMRAEEQRQQARGKKPKKTKHKGRRGRFRTIDK